MLYWIAMVLILAASAGLLIHSGITVSVFKRLELQREENYYEHDEVSERRSRKRPQQQVQQPQRRQRPEPVQAPQENKKKQWKIVLENLDTWEKKSFIFYDNIGIGRGKENPGFEKYLSIPDDGRISKVHCSIVRKGTRLYLKDEGSRNGTYLNGKKMEHPIVLQRDDVIGAGETRLEIKSLMRERD